MVIFDSELDKIYEVVKLLPLYKRRTKEECFLGILRSQNKKWIGWKYLGTLKKDIDLNDIDFFKQIYELALNFYWVRDSKNITETNLLKNYDF